LKLGIVFQGLIIAISGIFLSIDTAFMFGNEFFPRGFPIGLLIVQLCMAGTIVPVVYHIIVDNETTRFYLVLACIIDIVSVLGSVGWTCVFILVFWPDAMVPVGVGAKEMDENYEMKSRFVYLIGTIIFGTFLITLSVLYGFSVSSYMNSYGEPPYIYLYSDYQRDRKDDEEAAAPLIDEDDDDPDFVSGYDLPDNLKVASIKPGQESYGNKKW
jgi:hypothetical protein